jgi:hypothetical protein
VPALYTIFFEDCVQNAQNLCVAAKMELLWVRRFGASRAVTGAIAIYLLATGAVFTGAFGRFHT